MTDVITSPVNSIIIGGTSVDLSNIEWSLTVDHGRNDVTQAPQPSNAQFTTLGTSTIIGAIGSSLTVTAYNTLRFTGSITDMQITHLYSPLGTYSARVTYQAQGNFSKLGLLNVGAAGYPEESVALRTTEIMAETGLTYSANMDPMQVLLAQAATTDPQPALTLLSAICSQTGATMYDLPDGTIGIESYSRRGYDYNPATWAYVTGPWSDYSLYNWDDVYTASAAAPIPLNLVADSVIWEPVWRNNILTVVNRATVAYGATSPQSVILAEDTASQAFYGIRATVLPTQLSDPLDAYNRAGAIITAQSEPRYDLQQIQIFVDLLTSPQQTAVLALISGDRVQVNNLPSPAPLTQFLGIVEGWSEQYTQQGHVLTLSLSDPRYSYAMAEWISVDPTLIWGDVNTSVQWYNVVLPDDLLAA
jgi:hypothetical protein